ncbi:PepSY domain-containing protein [Natribaculum luteum]|uniref:PepSY domain-containing protein n=1 Tax=Natribaculum luteum TaxID=1586232 RepID=A0ABD5NZI3_9EURY|nr:PepSY domain-containing protein [Natribaculum luteum]
MKRQLLLVAMAVLLCTGAIGPAVVAGVSTADRQTNGGVDVTAGAQLSTVVTATSDEVRTEFENTAFDERIERGNESDRAAAIADRAAVLENRSATLRAEYEAATEAYRNGELDRSAYAQRLASLSARAQGVVESYDRLEERAAEVDDFELAAAGVNETALADGKASVTRLTGAGSEALLRHFTGEERGEVELEFDDGVSIEVESEDGERSREFERPRDGNGTLVISQSDALAIAEDTLSAANGTWILDESETDDGLYEFEFVLTGSEVGDAEVSVDGETGTVVALEEEIAARDEDEDDEDGEEDNEDDEIDEDDDDKRLAILVDEGTPNPGEQVTLVVLADGQPAAGATVAVNGQSVGETNDDGTITVTLPSEEADIEAEYADADAELEFEFDDEREDDSRFQADATVENGTATVSVTFDGEPVSGATVATDDWSGTTDDDGVVSFPFELSDDEDELEVDVVSGELETELELESDGDVVEDGDEDDAEDEDGEEDSEGDEEDDDSEGDEEDDVDDTDDDSEGDEEDDVDDTDDDSEGDEEDDVDDTDDDSEGDEEDDVDDTDDDSEDDDESTV